MSVNSNSSSAIIDPQYYSYGPLLGYSSSFGVIQQPAIQNPFLMQFDVGIGDYISREEARMLVKIGRESIKEANLRDNNPSLQEIWKEYQFTLALVQEYPDEQS